MAVSGNKPRILLVKLARVIALKSKRKRSPLKARESDRPQKQKKAIAINPVKISLLIAFR
jgi:hypothetical protein